MPLSIGLDTGLTGLRAAQAMVDTAAHNIANANTEGYSRQEVMFRAVPPAYSLVKSPGVVNQQLGLGVDTGRIRRLRDQLLDVQYRDLRATRDQAQAMTTALGQIESALGEPSDEGLQAQITRFFNAFRDVATNPESTAARAAAVEQGTALASAFNRVAGLLQAQRADLDTSVSVRVNEVNTLTTEMADLNQRIRIATVAGIESNDLKDRRDLLIDKLAGLTGARTQPLADGMVDLSIGSRKLVDGTTANALATLPNVGNNNLLDVVWASDSAPSGIVSGEIQGMLTSRDSSVSGMLTSLDDLVAALTTAVNIKHQAGYGLDNSTGLDFFSGSTADTLAVDATLRAAPEKLAVSDAPNEPGNPNGARAIAGVQRELLMSGGTATLDDAYRQVVARLGVVSGQAQSALANQDALTGQVDAARQSVSGVSIDDEMATLVKGQRAYGAAARIISTVDQMLDTLINRT